MASFRQYYLPYTYSRNQEIYQIWDSAFDGTENDEQYHNNKGGFNSHNSKVLNPCSYQTHNAICSASSSSSSGKRKCFGLSCAGCVIGLLAFLIILAFMAIIGVSIYLSHNMVTTLHSSPLSVAKVSHPKSGITITSRFLSSTTTTTTTTDINPTLLEDTPLSSSPTQPSSRLKDLPIDSNHFILRRQEKSDDQLNDEPHSDIGQRKSFTTTTTTSSIYSVISNLMNSSSHSSQDSILTDGSSMVDGFLVPITVSKTEIEEHLLRDSNPVLYKKYPNNDIVNEKIRTNNEEIADKTLYEDRIDLVTDHSTTLDMINLDSMLTTITPFSFCVQNEFECDSGQCIAHRDHCNRKIECNDGSDENDCTCVQYLKAEHQFNKICDGVIDCYDFTDEINCSYCKHNYICALSQVCIDKRKLCDGSNDCPNGEDESHCISLIPNDKTLESTVKHLNPEGSLYIQRKGEWAPLCLDDLNMEIDFNIQRINRRSDHLFNIEDLGRAICRTNYFNELESIQLMTSNNQNSKFFKIEFSNIQMKPSLSMWSSLFEKSECLSRKTPYVKCRDFECGVRPLLGSKRSRIIGGENAVEGSWPWQVALYMEGQFQCGGVIIDSEWLLTAAHCFQGTRDAYWTARFGILRRGNVFASPHEQLRRITHVLVHNDYVDNGFINDIALLRLDSPINYSKHIRPVCMPSESEDVSNWNRQLCTTVGWGKLYEHGRIFPDILQEVKLPVISTEECRKRTLLLPFYKITDNMFCAGYDRGGRDACLGDSGGPLMCQKSNGKWFLLGLTSNGDGCGRAGRPGVYTKVGKYRDWIHNIMNNDLEPEIIRTCDGLRCPLGRCLKKDHICNGIMDCRDGSDEQNCLNYNNHTIDREKQELNQ